MTIHPPLYKLDSKGKTRVWMLETDGAGSYRTLAGLIDGKFAISGWSLCEAKNVGRSNETSPATQCELEVAAQYTKKRDKHYVDSVEQINDERKYFEVMLAHKYDDHKDELDFKAGVFVQPKLEGIRGPTTQDGTFSRGGNHFPAVQFISETLAPIFANHPDLVFDGELYNHELRDDFNETVSTIKREKPTAEDYAKARSLAQLHVYDLFDPSHPEALFGQRNAFLQTLLLSYGIDPNFVKVVETQLVSSHEEIDQLYEDFLAEEYEGEIVRANGPYEHKRTASLLKRKETTDTEYAVVRIEAGKGNWAGCAKRVVCALPDGTEFAAGMKGTQAQQRKVLAEVQANPRKYKTATIRYHKLTPDGKPWHGRSIRLYEGARDD